MGFAGEKKMNKIVLKLARLPISPSGQFVVFISLISRFLLARLPAGKQVCPAKRTAGRQFRHPGVDFTSQSKFFLFP